MSVLILSDIHANLAALDAVLQHARGYDRIWCIGDTIGYGPRPVETLERMRTSAELIVCGNHDLACVGRLSLVDFNPDARRANLWNGAQLSEQQRDWLAGLAPQLSAEPRFHIAHGSPGQPVWEYLFSPDQALDNLEFFSENHCLIGHTHVQLAFRVDELRGRAERITTHHDLTLDLMDGPRYYVNPGSVGQPRDRDPRAAYALLDLANGTVRFQRVAYDIRLTQRQMLDVALPSALIQRLAYGV